MMRRILSAALLLGACSDSTGPSRADSCLPNPTTGAGATPALVVLDKGCVTDRYTAEVWAEGDVVYSTTYRAETLPGNALYVWDASGDALTLVDSVLFDDAIVLGDVQASDDGELLVVATERTPGSIVVLSLADPLHPATITRYSTASTHPGVHTAELARVGGTLYAFLSIDPLGSETPAKLVIVSLADPANPVEVFSQTMGDPFVHDVFVRDGILFTALWNEGLSIWDIGGAEMGGSPAAPVPLGNVATVGGHAHNVWWYHDESGGKRFAFVGEEGPGGVAGFSSSGDIHVVDVSDFANPAEVAFYRVPGAGAHNFSVDEASGILYAAYYEGGVRALDVTGDLASCTEAQQAPDGRCDLGLMGRELARALDGGGSFVWGVKLEGSRLFVSDMPNGIWMLEALLR
jgi:hypothetical protein